MSKIQVGYGDGGRPKGPKGAYGKVTSGKYKKNGGFSGEPTVDFTNITEEKWIKMFGTANLPKWKKELLEAGESLD